MIILKAKEHNWGLIGPGDWEKHSWKIQDDGWYEYKESYRSGIRNGWMCVRRTFTENESAKEN